MWSLSALGGGICVVAIPDVSSRIVKSLQAHHHR
jgi:hypothetical protein